MVTDKLQQDIDWFESFTGSEHYARFAEKPIAYFCAEYALSSSLPTYAGGLGVLAGDMVYEAAARGLPMRFVGIRYRRGQHQSIPHSVRFHRPTPGTLTLARDKDNFPLLLSLPLHGRTVWYQAWLWQDGDAQVYLLDTDLEQNDERDRRITETLYDEDREVRLKQEILLGVGGHRLLSALGDHPSVYHLNEGHSAFLALELIRHEMEHQRVDFRTACIYAKQHLLFTNHTIVSAGQELFEKELVAAVLAGYAAEAGIDIRDITALGTMENSGESTRLFSMTMLSFHLSAQANAVSKLHQRVARDIWRAYPMTAVTNGIALPRWDLIRDDATLLKDHRENKRRLLAYVQQETGADWDEDTLLLGWGRRVVPYKQPMAVLQDVERLRRLAADAKRPFRIIISGPTPEHGTNPLAESVKRHITEHLSDIAVYLPHYSLPVAQLLVSGCDVWLNTPMIGFEACGTSGMKAALNGTLLLSTRDGWVAEADLSHCGWVLSNSEHLGADLLSAIEHDVAPKYYEHLARPRRSSWLAYMNNGRKLIRQQFSMTHALRRYVEEAYIPLLQRKHTHKYR